MTRTAIPIRRSQFDLPGFAAYLASMGAEIGIPTNPYEVIRYRAFWQGGAKAVTHIVYTKENGLLTFIGGSAEHYRTFIGVDEPGAQDSRVRRPKNTSSVRAKLLKRDGECCWFCGGLLASAESNIEHLIPISAGGNNALANLVLSHSTCNTKAGSKTLAQKLELRAKLRGVVA